MDAGDTGDKIGKLETATKAVPAHTSGSRFKAQASKANSRQRVDQGICAANGIFSLTSNGARPAICMSRKRPLTKGVLFAPSDTDVPGDVRKSRSRPPATNHSK